MQQNTFTFTLGSWIQKADGFHKTAEFLENPLIDINYGFDSITSSWFLLHLSIELYLKAVSIYFTDKFNRSHGLKGLCDDIKGLSPEIDISLDEIIDGRTIRQWISFIEPFGSPNGGIRYHQPRKGLYAAPLGISHYFSNFIKTVKDTCDPKKEIDEKLLSKR